MMRPSCILIAGFFSRRISEASGRDRDVRVRADRCFEKYVRRGPVIPKWKKVMTAKDDWVARDFCECCDESITTARTSLGSKRIQKERERAKVILGVQ